MTNPPAKNPFFVPVWVLAFGFIIFGPLMAMGPRFMPGAIVYATLAMLPLLITRWQDAKGFFNNRVLWLCFAVVAYSCASALWSPTPKAIPTAIDLAYLSVCAAILAAELTVVPHEAKNTYLLFFSLSLLAGFFVLAEEFLFDHPIHRWFNGLSALQPLSENVTKRMVALFSLSIWPVAAWLEHVRNRTWALGAVGGFLWFSLISTSRAGALGMIVGVAILLATYFAPKITRYALMGLIVLGLAVAVPAFSVIDQAPESVKKLLFSSAQYRLKIWQYTAQHVPEAPIFGHGIDSSRGIQTTVGQDGLPYLKPGTSIIAQHPHNIFLQLWLDFGAVGVVLWGGLMLLLIYSIGRLPRSMQPYALGCAVCSIGLLCTTYSILQAWWGSAHIAAALMFMLAAQSASAPQAKNGLDTSKAL